MSTNNISSAAITAWPLTYPVSPKKMPAYTAVPAWERPVMVMCFLNTAMRYSFPFAVFLISALSSAPLMT